MTKEKPVIDSDLQKFYNQLRDDGVLDIDGISSELLSDRVVITIRGSQAKRSKRERLLTNPHLEALRK